MPDEPTQTEALQLTVVDFQDADHWRWVLQDPHGKFLADHTVSLDRSQPPYAGFLDLPGYLRYGAAPDRRFADEALLLQEVGAWMGEHVLGSIGPAILQYGTPVTVHVQLPPAAEALLYRPLELAYAEGKPLALQDVALVWEVATEERRVKWREMGERLRLLAVFSLPTDVRALGLRRERYSLQQLLRTIAQSYGLAIELKVLQYGVTRERLADVLKEGEGWDVLHFSGHGKPGELVLEKADGRQDTVKADELLTLLRPARGRLKLVTLASCLSAATTVQETLRLLGIVRDLTPSPPTPLPQTGEGKQAPALARQLVKELDCAVLAMRYPVGDDFAIALGQGLYELLLGKGQALPRALQMALPLALAASAGPGGPPLSVATPALFGQRALDLVLKPPEAPLGEFALAPTGLAYFPPEPERFVGRIGPLARASAALAPQSGRTGVLFYGMAGAGKTACALELAYRHAEGRFRAFVWWKAPNEGTDIAGALSSLAQDMEKRLPGLKMVHVVDRPDELQAWLPELRQVLEKNSILLVLDNLESLLTPEGQWRDEPWGWLLTTLLEHKGLSRTVLTSRVRPAGLDEKRVLVEAVHALSLDEAVLLAREMPNLGQLLSGEGLGLQQGLELLSRTLKVVQGHPKLIELADGQAADRGELQKHLDRASAAWETGGARLETFFQRGETEAGPEAFLAQLSGWTLGLAAALPEASRVLFRFLCALEEEDRQSWIAEANWADLWQRLGRAGGAPELAVAVEPLLVAGLVERERIEVRSEAGEAQALESYHIHPGVAEAGRAEAGADFQAAVDAELAAFWETVFAEGLKEELRGGGGVVVAAGQRAAPYLLRQQRWGEARTLLEGVVNRDPSPGTGAAVLPWLRRIADLSQGTETELMAAGVLARALLRAGRWQEAESMQRDIVRRAVERGEFRTASVAVTYVINTLQATGRAEEGLAWVEEMKDYTRRAGLGPWTQLLDEMQRLQLLNALGRYAEVLQRVQELRPQMLALPEQSQSEEAAAPWNVRECILDTGREAALRLERWEEALALNAANIASKEARGAPELALARTRYNDYGPLLRLRRSGEARALLDACREVYEREKDLEFLGKDFGALASLEDTLGHREQAIAFGETALRYSYLCGDPQDCAIHHHNLSTYLQRAGRERQTALAHRLAAGLIRFQTDSGQLAMTRHNLAIDLAEFAPQLPPFPASFDELCAIVEQVEGVRFRELFARLPARAASGDEALQQVIALAQEEARRGKK